MPPDLQPDDARRRCAEVLDPGYPVPPPGVGIDALIKIIANKDGTASGKIYNIGNQRPVDLLRYIEIIEQCLGRKAEMNLMPLQRGDVPDTWADVTTLTHDVGYRSSTPVEEGVRRFVEWYRSYYDSNPT